MIVEPNIANIAALMGDPSRVTILVALLGKDALPASELAHKAYISPQTASSHLSKLVAGKLLAVERHGRHRYYRLASAEVGRFIETLATIAPLPRISQSEKVDEDAKSFRLARTCYDHLAGRVAVEIACALEEKKLMTRSGRNFDFTASGENWLKELGINTGPIRQERRAFGLQCLDWSERRNHIAGAIGAALLERMFALGWLARINGTRSVRVTLNGRKALSRLLGLRI
jgi:DNA-binding transcriptional ArsR family regulator